MQPAGRRATAAGLVLLASAQNFRNQMKKFEAEQKSIQDAKIKEKAQVSQRLPPFPQQDPGAFQLPSRFPPCALVVRAPTIDRLPQDGRVGMGSAQLYSAELLPGCARGPVVAMNSQPSICTRPCT